MRSRSAQDWMVDSIISPIANLIVLGNTGPAVRFCEITADEDWQAVRELRKQCYPASLPYLTDVLNADGSDRHDRHSLVYAAFLGGNAVATIRATTYPYETLDHLSDLRLASFLGDRWKTDYIEWGRLLVDRRHARMRLAQALITFAGLRLLALTPYRSYFGYTKPRVRDAVVSKFAIQRETLRFEIPSRGPHSYLLTKGNLASAAAGEIPKWLQRFGKRLGRLDERSLGRVIERWVGAEARAGQARHSPAGA